MTSGRGLSLLERGMGIAIRRLDDVFDSFPDGARVSVIDSLDGHQKAGASSKNLTAIEQMNRLKRMNV